MQELFPPVKDIKFGFEHIIMMAILFALLGVMAEISALPANQSKEQVPALLALLFACSFLCCMSAICLLFVCFSSCAPPAVATRAVDAACWLAPQTLYCTKAPISP
jgi:xanthine/uracil permease